MSSSTPPQTTTIKLFHLPDSRSIRIVWLLEELGLLYEIISSTRLPNFDSPPEFRTQIGALGKVPTVHDGELVVQESGAIVEYLCTAYPSADSSRPLLPTEPLALRTKVLEYVHMAEGTFLLHASPLLYARRALLPDTPSPEDKLFVGIQTRVVKKVREDLGWLESELALQKEKGSAFLVGDHLTAADIMMAFSVGLILERATSVNAHGEKYGCVMRWIGGLRSREALKRAMEKVEFNH